MGYLDRIVKEVAEIQLHPQNFKPNFQLTYFGIPDSLLNTPESDRRTNIKME